MRSVRVAAGQAAEPPQPLELAVLTGVATSTQPHSHVYVPLALLRSRCCCGALTSRCSQMASRWRPQSWCAVPHVTLAQACASVWHAHVAPGRVMPDTAVLRAPEIDQVAPGLMAVQASQLPRPFVCCASAPPAGAAATGSAWDSGDRDAHCQVSSLPLRAGDGVLLIFCYTARSADTQAEHNRCMMDMHASSSCCCLSIPQGRGRRRRRAGWAAAAGRLLRATQVSLCASTTATTAAAYAAAGRTGGMAV